jgi:hypothetical protein
MPSAGWEEYVKADGGGKRRRVAAKNGCAPPFMERFKALACVCGHWIELPDSATMNFLWTKVLACVQWLLNLIS